MQQAQRGVFDLRRGKIVHIQSANGSYLAASVEGITTETLDRMRQLAGHPLHLVLTGHRARFLGMDVTPQTPGVAIPVAADMSVTDLLEIAMGAREEEAGPLPDLLTLAAGDAAALAMVRASLLVPAVITARLSGGEEAELKALLEEGHILSVPAEQALNMADEPDPSLVLVSEAEVPLEDSPKTRFLLFREGNGLLEHLAVLIGDRAAWRDPVPARLHSACLTGDLFGSLRCDCGEQLRSGVRLISNAGGGVLLYLAQEGRGIGLANKLRAYSIQDDGMDTVDADCRLGFGGDERRYEAAVQMLNMLEIRRVSVFTNNPVKLSALVAGGIEVHDRQAVHGRLNPHNLRYLTAKAERSGHLLADVLDQSRR